MIIDDRRTLEQKKTHRFLAVATDSAMSGWGKAVNGTSYAGWAFTTLAAARIQMWRLGLRPGMKRVRLVTGDWKPRGTGHTSIYVGD